VDGVVAVGISVVVAQPNRAALGDMKSAHLPPVRLLVAATHATTDNSPSFDSGGNCIKQSKVTQRRVESSCSALINIAATVDSSLTLEYFNQFARRAAESLIRSFASQRRRQLAALARIVREDERPIEKSLKRSLKICDSGSRRASGYWEGDFVHNYCLAVVTVLLVSRGASW
jgi:hypothetical protein